jgi:hypothetical protein
MEKDSLNYWDYWIKNYSFFNVQELSNGLKPEKPEALLLKIRFKRRIKCEF